MKFPARLAALVMLAGGAAVASVTGCQSSQPDVKTNVRTQWTVVKADPQATTDAAKAVLASAQMKDVKGSSTSVDGHVTAKKADGTEIKVDIERASGGSEVKVNVGTMGDET